VLARLAAVLFICLLLPGCATLAGFTIGAVVTAAGLGAIGGASKFATERLIRKNWTHHVAWKRCRHLRGDPQRLELCVRKYIDLKREFG
jgi:hypothetical protein